MDADKIEKAIFAGGCFWCMETPYAEIPGIIDVISGYTGGKEVNPTYEDVAYGRTGHLESVEITFDPAIISYEKVLEIFWKQIDPTDDGGQFVDRGHHYKTAIFYLNDSQKLAAEKSKADLDKSGIFKQPIVTEIRSASKFYPAEDYHQDFYRKSPQHYKNYRYNSGRDSFLNKIWGNK